MKKLCAIFLFVFVILALAGCNSGKEENTVIPDFSYWQENIENEGISPYFSIDDATKLGGINDNTVKEDVLKFMESVEYTEVCPDFTPTEEQKEMCHSVRLTNYYTEHEITLSFYDDFNYGCFSDRYNSLQPFAVKDPEQCKQFFKDYDMYLSVEEVN